ncbi:hypothetical protein [Aeromonas veronii]|uniref:hypothetical protein n=1 Tax=Aeromonas veronii TaxID=654 RepID=UPI001F0A6002|nr:hypothetical protein [Aeromonas veronii]
MAYEVCDALIDDAVRHSQMDNEHLTTLRSQVMAAKDLAFFERLFSTTSDKLLRAYSAHSIEQAREMAFRDTRQWELLLLGKVRTSIPRTKNENFSHLISMGYQ